MLGVDITLYVVSFKGVFQVYVEIYCLLPQSLNAQLHNSSVLDKKKNICQLYVMLM